MDLKELTKLYDFSDRTAVITGGAGIIGGEMACALVGCCANVAILDRAPELADRLIERFEGGPGKAIVVYADVLKPDTMHKAEQVIQTEFNSSVNMLINAAGGNNSKATTSDDLPFFDLPEEALRFVFDLNLLGTFLSSQVFGRGMAELGEGVIVNISSMAALRPLTRIPAYSAAKSGVSNFTNRFLLTDADSGELTDRGRTILKHTPMDRFGDPEDLLGTLLWLLSPASAFVTGVVVPVDGGFSAFSGV